MKEIEIKANVYISGKFRECMLSGFSLLYKEHVDISCWEWKNGSEDEAKKTKENFDTLEEDYQTVLHIQLMIQTINMSE